MKKYILSLMIFFSVTLSQAGDNVGVGVSFSGGTTNASLAFIYNFLKTIITDESDDAVTSSLYIPSIDIMFPIISANDSPEGLPFGRMHSPYYRYWPNQFKRFGDFRLKYDLTLDFKKSPFGLYFGVGYKTVQVCMSESRNSRVHYFVPEAGIRLKYGGTSYSGSYFLIEIGAEYDKALGYKGFIDSKDAVNSGFSGRVSVGVGNESTSIFLQYEHPFYNYFNNSYTPDGGLTYPLENVNRKVGYISIGFRLSTSAFE